MAEKWQEIGGVLPMTRECESAKLVSSQNGFGQFRRF